VRVLLQVNEVQIAFGGATRLASPKPMGDVISTQVELDTRKVCRAEEGGGARERGE